MKVEAQYEATKFKPVNINITIEDSNEYTVFIAMLGKNITIGEFLFAEKDQSLLLAAMLGNIYRSLTALN